MGDSCKVSDIFEMVQERASSTNVCPFCSESLQYLCSFAKHLHVEQCKLEADREAGSEVVSPGKADHSVIDLSSPSESPADARVLPPSSPAREDGEEECSNSRRGGSCEDQVSAHDDVPGQGAGRAAASVVREESEEDELFALDLRTRVEMKMRGDSACPSVQDYPRRKIRNTSGMKLGEMPKYEEMEVRELKELMSSYGMKSGSKTFMVQKLKSIWHQLHVQEEGEEGRAEEEPAKGRDNTAANERRRRKVEESLVACVDLLRENEAYDEMLLCQNLSLTHISKILKDANLPISSKMLCHLLDDQGISYSFPQNEKDGKSRHRRR
ncbi:hypothetical protein GUITHDRAFT_140670 [Guillardia theta CCMP2712]|uniref:SAP domain-containing protein n=1 Tax=Guillardia theta (strain CCMP2712) TaxID=905079 RepID=L1J416_GUITC|nr:hypothetical protein GUITHDRAFT_140670 [Guillardia theta CCMP2712]EKX43077.1 hypothetical protein GUITHDRAFT_140670 [Guillardia theta CCMP2712]|eukprot:XP_005830057.1 hypothetical protein GUITHDRAFT_140670 [Guillardia theta CCMP2712]